MDKLNFLTAGIPLRTKPRNYDKAFQVLDEMGLDGIELEFVRGVRISKDSLETVSNNSKKYLFTAHGPFYINLNSKEPDKVEASVQRIIETAQVASAAGAYSITYHAAYYLEDSKRATFKNVLKQTQRIIDELKKQNINIWVRPEKTGKATQWGDLNEIIELSKEFDNVLPCVDFSYLHSRYGGTHNTYDEFCQVLEKMDTKLGRIALDNFHGHLAGIAYSAKGEKHHLELEQSDMNYKDLLKALKSFNVKGALVCESPNIEDDCQLIKEYYLSL